MQQQNQLKARSHPYGGAYYSFIHSLTFIAAHGGVSLSEKA
jgi:hypothetical protein